MKYLLGLGFVAVATTVLALMGSAILANKDASTASTPRNFTWEEMRTVYDFADTLEDRRVGFFRFQECRKLCCDGLSGGSLSLAEATDQVLEAAQSLHPRTLEHLRNAQANPHVQVKLSNRGLVALMLIKYLASEGRSDEQIAVLQCELASIDEAAIQLLEKRLVGRY